MMEDVRALLARYHRSPSKGLGQNLLVSEAVYERIVAAAALTLRGKRKSKSVDPSQQVFVKAKDRVRLVKMKSEVQE